MITNKTNITEEIIDINGIILKKYPYDNDYYVSPWGHVFSLKSLKFMKMQIRSDRYCIDIKGKHVQVYRMVYETWVGPIPEGLQINHKDDNPRNNCINNLYAGTQKENIADCIRNGHRDYVAAYKLVVLDKKVNKVLTFCPASNFIEYCGHSATNGNIKRMTTRDWFKERYQVISFKSYYESDD